MHRYVILGGIKGGSRITLKSIRDRKTKSSSEHPKCYVLGYEIARNRIYALAQYLDKIHDGRKVPNITAMKVSNTKKLDGLLPAIDQWVMVCADFRKEGDDSIIEWWKAKRSDTNTYGEDSPWVWVYEDGTYDRPSSITHWAPIAPKEK